MAKQIGPINPGGRERVRDPVTGEPLEAEQLNQEEESMARGGRRDGPGAAGSGSPASKPEATTSPLTSPLLQHPKVAAAEAAQADVDRARAELDPFLEKVKAAKIALDTRKADNREWLDTVFKALNDETNYVFETMETKARAEQNARKQEIARVMIGNLHRKVRELSHFLSDAPERLIHEMENFNAATLASRPGLNYWKETAKYIEGYPKAFDHGLAAIKSLFERLEGRLDPPKKIISEDERDFGFIVDRTTPPEPRGVGFDVFNYDKPTE